MPGTRKGIGLLKQDESRHIAYGVYLLSRLINAEPRLWDVVVERMNDLVVYAMGVIDDAFACYDVIPFGLSHDDFMHFAMGQFQRRLDRIERARDQTPEALDEETPEAT
jgi:Ribonucleotide reductase, beta subunit